MYERHLRQLRRRNSARRQSLLDAIHHFLGDRVDVTGDAAGAQVLLRPRKRVSEKPAMDLAVRHGVGIYGISHCYLKHPSPPGFLLGYARLNQRDIHEGIRLLGEVF